MNNLRNILFFGNCANFPEEELGSAERLLQAILDNNLEQVKVIYGNYLGYLDNARMGRLNYSHPKLRRAIDEAYNNFVYSFRNN